MENNIHVRTFIDQSFKTNLSIYAEKYSDNIFIVDDEQTYTWKEIDMCSQIIAADLSALGVKRGTHVGICSGNSSNWILTFFAVQKLGAIACLINPGYNVAEIINVAKLGDISCLCYGETSAESSFDRLSDIVASSDSPIKHCYDIDKNIYYKDRLNEYESLAEQFGNFVESDDVCVMIFTSGSTGIPKGILLSAYNILNASSFTANNLKMTSDDSLCLILPLFHIFGLVAGLFSTALSGGKLVIPKDIHTDTLLNVISDKQCTIFHSVPTMMIALMHNKDFSPEKVKSIRATIISGASPTEAQFQAILEHFPDDTFLSSYGLSEMAPVSVTKLNDSLNHILTTVGRPVDNIEIKIADPINGKECQKNESGEILVRGYNAMLCYYKTDLEAQAIDMNGWIHTGDLGMMDDEGYLHFTGRIKELIIKGGENIMPLEVASVISQNPDVFDVKVVGVPDFFFGEIVCACLVMNEGTEFNEEKMNEFISDRLARFKLPSMYMIYDSFPMLSNGKVDMVTLKNDAEKRHRS